MFRQYLKSATRVLLKNRSFAVTVIATFAFTIGVNATIFSLRDATLERALDVADAENLVAIYGMFRGEIFNDRFSRSDYAYYKEHIKGVSELAAHYSTSPMTYSADDRAPQPILGSTVSANFFPMLGLRPAVGRFFLPEEGVVDGRDAVAVISYLFWTEEFGADPNIVGKRIKLNGTGFTVIGVAPANFRGILTAGAPIGAWIPLSMSSVAYRACDTQKPNCLFLDMIGRLVKGNSVKQLQAEMDLLAQQLRALKPESARPASDANSKDVVVMPQRGIGANHRPQLTRLLDLLTNSAFVLLLIACVNVSGLYLVQMAARTKEMAMRLALGANQRQLCVQMLTETGLLSLIGGIGGLLMTYWLSRSLSRFPLLDSLNYISDVRIDTSVIIFTVALVTLCAVIAAIIPAIRLSRSDLFASLKDQHSGGSAKTARTHDALIVAQVALSLALVAGGGLLMVSLRTILSGPGYDPSRLVFFRVTPQLIGYSAEKSAALQREILARLSALPGVEAVSLGTNLPWWPTRQEAVALPGKMPTRDEEKFLVGYNPIAPKYLSTLQVPLVSGRDFNEGDRRDTPQVVIINESLAARLFPNSNAVGNVLVIGETDPSDFTIVGVSKDAQYRLASVKSAPYFYVPYWQHYNGSDARFCIRTTGDPRAVMPAIQREIQNIDPDTPMTKIVTMDQGLKAWFSPVYLADRVLMSASAIACFLSMLGLYSLIAFSVVKRHREIGIRIALGASRRQILKLMMQRAVVLAALGAVFGIALAITSLRIFDSLLYGVSPANPIVLIAAAVVLISVSLIAGFFPAQRATRIDPIKVIRDE